MITVNFYFDQRKLLADGTAPVRVSLTKDCQVRYVATSMAVEPGTVTDGEEEKEKVSALEVLSRPANELAPEDFGVIDYAAALEEISASIGGNRDAAREIVNEEIEKAKAEASEIWMANCIRLKLPSRSLKMLMRRTRLIPMR